MDNHEEELIRAAGKCTFGDNDETEDDAFIGMCVCFIAGSCLWILFFYLLLRIFQ